MPRREIPTVKQASQRDNTQQTRQASQPHSPVSVDRRDTAFSGWYTTRDRQIATRCYGANVCHLRSCLHVTHPFSLSCKPPPALADKRSEGGEEIYLVMQTLTERNCIFKPLAVYEF